MPDDDSKDDFVFLDDGSDIPVLPLESLLKTLPPLVVTDAPCSFHRVLSANNNNSSRPFVVPVSIRAAAHAGKKLDEQDVVSLVFLLVKDEDNALELCRKVERGEYPKPVGPMFMASLVKTGMDQKLNNWDIKVMCAMHPLRRYKLIQTLVGLSKQDAIAKFDNREYLYLDHFRVGLFKLAYNLNKSDSASLLHNFVQDLHPTDELKLRQESFLETNLLEMMCQKRLYPGEPIVKIASRLPNSKTTFLPISKGEVGSKLRRGYCVILNCEKFRKDPWCPKHRVYDDRVGTELDVKRLVETWERFDCEVRVVAEKTSQEIVKEFENLSCKNFDKYGFLVVCLLSHGDRVDKVDFIMGTDGLAVDIQKKIVLPLVDARCSKTLLGKLKLFVVQACRGQSGQEQSTFVRQDGLTTRDGGERCNAMPSISDYIIFNSTIADFASFRNVNEGSYFVQMLCQELNENSRYYDIHKLLRNVMDNVQGTTGNQQPEITTTYAKDAFLFDKMERREEEEGDRVVVAGATAVR